MMPTDRSAPVPAEVASTRPLDRHTLVRQLNEVAVLDAIFSGGPVSRVAVADTTGLSKPTVNTVVSALCNIGLVHQVGTTNGQVGRSAALYAVNPSAGHIIGVDLGASKIRVAVANLFGEIVRTDVVATDRRGHDNVIHQIGDLTRTSCEHANVKWSTVQSIVVATPGVTNRDTGKIALASNIHGLDRLSVVAELQADLQVELVVENDANVAAVGEGWRGCATGCDNFVFLAVGTGIGMGIIADGDLFRGSAGAAGEISYLPIGADPFVSKTRRVGALEEVAAGAGIRRLARKYRDQYPRTSLPRRPTVKQIFAAAAADDALGNRLLDEEARTIALAALASCSVLNPELIVLGGGIGANSILLDPVQRYLAQAVPYPVRVESSQLGDMAVLFGALAIGLRNARASLLPTEPRADA